MADPDQSFFSRYGPWAVIAGGSEGIGASFAHQLADRGLNLVLIARKPGPLRETATAVRALGVEVRTLALDLLDPNMFRRVHELTVDVDVGLLVYNAGANSYGHDFVTGDLARFRAIIELSISAQLEMTHHFGADMRARRRGGIILVGSLAGYVGQPQITIYSAVKAFSRVFAEGLWLELREHDVDVLELVLGLTRTPAMSRAGVKLDVPGLAVAEPDDVAREGLEHLADGPVWVAGGNGPTAERRCGADRAKLVASIHEASKALLPPSD